MSYRRRVAPLKGVAGHLQCCWRRGPPREQKVLHSENERAQPPAAQAARPRARRRAVQDGVTEPFAGLLLLHGRHMQPGVLEPFVHALALPVRCLVPAGPVRHDDGSHSWWEVNMQRRQAELAVGPIDLARRAPAGRAAAREALARSVDSLSATLRPGEPLIVAGFSQGAMLALDYLLQSGDRRIAALVLLSASRIATQEWQPHLHRLAGLPVLLAHGRQDTHLSFAAGEALRALLTGAGAQVQWLAFEGGHELPLVVWRALRRFVLQLAPG